MMHALHVTGLYFFIFFLYKRWDSVILGERKKKSNIGRSEYSKNRGFNRNVEI